LQLETVQAYGIANFTLTQSAATVNDYLYASGGVLYSAISSGYMILDYDPTLSTSGNLLWTKDGTGTSYLSFNYDGWTDYDSDPYGVLIGSQTITDLRIKLDSTANIENILLRTKPPLWVQSGEATIILDTPEWIQAGDADFWIIILFNQGTIDYLLMFVGLALLPVSTLFLVYGGKKNMSVDKLLVFLLLFFVACGMIIGGLLL